MATPITHILIAEMAMEKLLKGKDRKRFIIGTSLPDVRYLGSVTRDETHPVHGFSEVREAESFLSGYMFHSLIDRVRKKVLLEHESYRRAAVDRLSIVAIKFIEDMLFYDEVHDWKEVCSMFDTILNDEELLGIDDEHIRLWHQGIKAYLSRKPNDESRSGIYRLLQLPKGADAKINGKIAELVGNMELVETLKQMPSLVIKGLAEDKL